MALDPSSVGLKGEPTKRTWTSKDALLYAVGVGAGTSELPFTTENTKDTPQRVLPTMAVILGGGGVPMDKAGTFNPALMVHGTEGIELFDEIPANGEIESVGEITGVWDKGKAAVLEMESTSTLVMWSGCSRSDNPRRAVGKSVFAVANPVVPSFARPSSEHHKK